MRATYVLKETGYTNCACEECFNLAIGSKGEVCPLCSDCESAGCETYCECQYFDEEEDMSNPEGQDEGVAVKI